jgi:hypothetical protein
MILTGQAQTAGYKQADFQTYVCGQIPALFICGNVYVDVQSFRSFSTWPSTVRSTPPTILSATTCSTIPGGPGDIVVVQLFNQWPLFVTGLGYNIANLNGIDRDGCISATSPTEVAR